MNRAQLEHVIAAACHVAAVDELVVLGSQAVLGQFPDAPAELLVSMEVDVYPRHHVERAALIEGSIGELSMFHETFGYYAEGVAPETATLPRGWEERLIRIEGPGTGGKIGWALEIHDLVVGKYVAARDKDRRYNRVVLRHGLVRMPTLTSRLAETPIGDERRAAIAAWITADAASLGG